MVRFSQSKKRLKRRTSAADRWVNDTWKSSNRPLMTNSIHPTNRQLIPTLTNFSAGTLQSAPPFTSNSLSKKKMAITLSPSHSIPHVHVSQSLSSMSILRRLPILHLKPQKRRLATLVNAAVRQDTTVWTPAPLAEISPAAESLFHISVDISDAPDIASTHTSAGQYLQLRVADVAKPTFLAIASPPSFASASGAFEFLVKSLPGSTAEVLCGLKKGDVVEITQVMGRGFDIDRIQPPDEYPTVLIFATGSGISPIRSLMESGFSAKERSDVRLYYGARNLRRMAYQDRFKEWESSGVKIVPVLSQPHGNWSGETGYVQAAFAKAKQIFNPRGTGVVLCGQKQMAEEVTSIVLAEGVSSEKILKNF